jgi:hypothetical protein
MDSDDGRPSRVESGPGQGSGLHPGRSSATLGELKYRFGRMEDRLRNMEECVTSKDYELRSELRKLES